MFGTSPKTYHGTILSDIDNKNRGRYLVNIPDLHVNVEGNKGIWCVNKLSNYTRDSVNGDYGNYFPLQPGTRVKVSIQESQETGEVVGLVSDKEDNSTPLGIPPKDRDSIYQVFKTSKSGNLMIICEEGMVSNPGNSMHIYFNTQIPGESYGGDKDGSTFSNSKIRTRIIFDSNGLHIAVADNLNISINNDSNIAINGNSKVKISGNLDLHVLGETKITSDGPIHLKSNSEINIDGSAVNINSGKANSAEDNNGYETYSDKELRTISREKSTKFASSLGGSDVK
jgi:hypothetical protein